MFRVTTSLKLLCAAFAAVKITALGYALLLTGCERAARKHDAFVTGNVLIEGELVDSGTVTFHHVEHGVVASGRITPNGGYSLRTGQGDPDEILGSKVPSGDYVITVIVNAPSEETLGTGGPPLAGPRLVDDKYVSVETSDLRATVRPGRNVIPLELDGRHDREDEASNGQDESAEIDEIEVTEFEDDKDESEADAADDKDVAEQSGSSFEENEAPKDLGE